METPTYWRNSAFAPLVELHREMDRVFNGKSASSSSSEWFSPACDIEETQDHFLLSLDMPGMRKEDIRIELHDDQLVISGERAWRRGSGDDKSTRRVERGFGRFHRSFTLPREVDSSKIEADYQNGVLDLVVPKVEAVKPRQIRIGESKGLFSKLLRNETAEKTPA